MAVRAKETKCTTQIYSCDICGVEQEYGMHLCEICGRDICHEHMVWSHSSCRHNRICIECNELGTKKNIFNRENAEDKRRKETDNNFDKMWEEISSVVRSK